MSCLNPVCPFRQNPLPGNYFCEGCRGKAGELMDAAIAPPEGCMWEGARLFVVIEDGDSLMGIANRFGVTLDDLKVQLAHYNPHPPTWKAGARYEVPPGWATLKRWGGGRAP